MASLHSSSILSRLSKRSGISDTSPLAAHLGNDNAMRRVLRDGVGIKDIQKKYLSMCYTSRPTVRPDKNAAQGLAAGELMWDLTISEKSETIIIASLLNTKEAQRELRCLILSTGGVDCSSVRKRAGRGWGPKGGGMGAGSRGVRGLAMEKDPTGEVELFRALCKALPHLDALRSLELDGLRSGFQKTGIGAARLARGLKDNPKLKSLTLRHVRLVDERALGVLASALCGHPTIATLSLGHCGLAGKAGGGLAAAVIRAHAARRDGMVWSVGLRRPYGVVGTTAAAAPATIATAGCLALDLSGNRLGDSGVLAVAQSLQSDTWLVGLNLSSNEVTDHGAAILSACLKHNATLGAVVLDDNPDIGQEAEGRITAEIEARSIMPEAILKEPEVVRTLASWGFSAQARGEVDSDSQPQPVAESESAASKMSDASGVGFNGGGLCTGFPSGALPSGHHTSPRERDGGNGDTGYDSFHWAGYASTAPRANLAHADVLVGAAGSHCRTFEGDGSASTARLVDARGRSRHSVSQLKGRPSAQDEGPVRDAAEGEAKEGRRVGGGGGGARVRALSSRSQRDEDCIGIDGECATERIKSWRLPTRDGARAPSGKMAASAMAERAPWGAGGHLSGGARARARAWADTRFAGGGHAGVLRGNGSGSCVGGDNLRGASDGLYCVPRIRIRARRGRGMGGSSVAHKASRRPSKIIRRRMTAGRKAGMDAESESRSRQWFNGCGDEDGDGDVFYERRGAQKRRALSEVDVTRDVLRWGGVTPELGAPTGDGNAAEEAATTGAIRHQAARSIDGYHDDGCTDRVVNMLETLQEAVVDVCREMWRLEERVEGSDSSTRRGSKEGKEDGDDADADPIHGSGARGDQEMGDLPGGGRNGLEVSSPDRHWTLQDRRYSEAAEVETCQRQLLRGTLVTTGEGSGCRDPLGGTLSASGLVSLGPGRKEENGAARARLHQPFRLVANRDEEKSGSDRLGALRLFELEGGWEDEEKTTQSAGEKKGQEDGNKEDTLVLTLRSAQYGPWSTYNSSSLQ